ncbi:sulfotransferase family cytosolic 1B member 1-like isoform X2 [Limulus polyphemus]|uniref:Sulfotransferase family cytosolic 1B member 1-like isoform X1 n=2 Tax=Limulus polyphemus TaxID=6850 RepID=A0ABM1SPZ5_LIMPO|nr:sulfotransferase family cytosolic 1B member 1-like isoform X1 [Limulus polyphemus]XP_022245701.1 sulfotransferase family cytosolic 1B member 1-like isoform X2 [Limulus polyphemus]
MIVQNVVLKQLRYLQLEAMLSVKFLYNTPLSSLINATRSKTKTEKENQVISAEKYPLLDNDPVKAAYVRCIPKAQFYKDVLLQGYFVPPYILQGLEEFEVRPDDIFIITYPKSGTTWTEEIVSLIFNDGDTKKVQNKLLFYRVHHLEVGRPIGHFRYLRKVKSPRLMATHLPLNCIPRQLRQSRCKIIYVVRNPKDNAVSYYHHHRMSTFLGNYKGPWDEFLTLFLKGHLVYGSWFDHVLTYWKFHLDHPDKVLFISYEELKIDLEKMVERIANFLDHPLPAETIKTIASHCSFDQMKNNNMVNREQLPVTDFFDMSQSKFMRKGIIGDWKNYFTDDQNQEFETVYKEKMAGSGLDFVFEPEEAFKRMKTYGRIILPCQIHTNKENGNLPKGFGEDKKLTNEQKTGPSTTDVSMSPDVVLCTDETDSSNTHVDSPNKEAERTTNKCPGSEIVIDQKFDDFNGEKMKSKSEADKTIKKAQKYELKKGVKSCLYSGVKERSFAENDKGVIYGNQRRNLSDSKRSLESTLRSRNSMSGSAPLDPYITPDPLTLDLVI